MGFDEAQLKILLIKRGFEPKKGEWSLLGGFLDSKETLDEAAHRIVKELSGISKIFLEQFHTYSEPKRDPGNRVLSVAYVAFLKIKDFDKVIHHNHGAEWFSLEDLPKLIFDHNQMVQDALGFIRQRNRFKPIGFELLPDKFTIPQLQKLYEAIYQKKYDNANFRKKIMSLKVLKKLNEKHRNSSKRGAYLYKFDKTKYKSASADESVFLM
jgi:ADP-ribose pyrophosphatase YjhB (NUDIX family)